MPIRGWVDLAERSGFGLDVPERFGPDSVPRRGSWRYRPHSRNRWLEASSRSIREEHDLTRPGGRLVEGGHHHEPHRGDGESQDENHERDNRTGVAGTPSVRHDAPIREPAHAEYRRSCRRRLLNVGSMPVPVRIQPLASYRRRCFAISAAICAGRSPWRDP